MQRVMDMDESLTKIAEADKEEIRKVISWMCKYFPLVDHLLIILKKKPLHEVAHCVLNSSFCKIWWLHWSCGTLNATAETPAHGVPQKFPLPGGAKFSMQWLSNPVLATTREVRQCLTNNLTTQKSKINKANEKREEEIRIQKK